MRIYKCIHTHYIHIHIYIIHILYTLYIIIQLYTVLLSVLALFEQREGLSLPSPQERWENGLVEGYQRT